ncbi:MAG: hypothetical protein JWN86_2699 [Planctomycetota bacterium]|nr:hypothetical protein [Planctomycetota bacterium]
MCGCKARPARGRFALALIAAGGSLPLLLAIVAVSARGTLDALLFRVALPLERLLVAPGVNLGEDMPFARYVVAPIFLGAIVSGPLLGKTLAPVLSRFRIVITPRTEELCDASIS